MLIDLVILDALRPINPRKDKVQEQDAIVLYEVLNDACSSGVSVKRGSTVLGIIFQLMCDKGKKKKKDA